MHLSLFGIFTTPDLVDFSPLARAKSLLRPRAGQRCRLAGYSDWVMASYATSIPSRVGFVQQDTSLSVWPHDMQPCFGMRLHQWAAQQMRAPTGIYQGELILDPMPLNAAPPGLPLTPNGCVDILQLIGPRDATSHPTNAGRLADKISSWASSSLRADGIVYNRQSRDGIVRALPEPPAGGPWHGPVQLYQPANTMPAGQVDVLFAMAKCNWRCGVPYCQKILNPLSNGHDAPRFVRHNNWIWHHGMRGLTAADNNMEPFMICDMCCNKGEN